MDENLHDLGFGQKPQKKQEEKREQKPEYRGKGGKKDKVVINDDDFPTLWKMICNYKYFKFINYIWLAKYYWIFYTFIEEHNLKY